MNLAVIGSRTYPLTKKQFDALGDGTKRHTPAQLKALRKGKALVEARVKAELAGGRYARVVSGGADGPDSWGVEAAKAVGYIDDQIDVIRPDWDRYGKSAGFKRNTTIVERGDVVLAFWDGKSRGTLDSIEKAHKMGKLVIVVFPNGRERSSK